MLKNKPLLITSIIFGIIGLLILILGAVLFVDGGKDALNEIGAVFGMEKGKLIVLEGIDGSGKSAHYRRICEKLKRDGIAYDHIVFPRYDKESSALIRMYLSGQFGSHPNDVNAYTASTFFAVDRFASYKQDWGEKYNAGSFILSDRYTT